MSNAPWVTGRHAVFGPTRKPEPRPPLGLDIVRGLELEAHYNKLTAANNEIVDAKHALRKFRRRRRVMWTLYVAGAAVLLAMVRVDVPGLVLAALALFTVASYLGVTHSLYGARGKDLQEAVDDATERYTQVFKAGPQ